jgi:hypothetical protein
LPGRALLSIGDPDRAYALLRPLDHPDRLPTLVQYMSYPDFDARRFPLLQSKLNDDRVVRPMPIAAPYTCPKGMT